MNSRDTVREAPLESEANRTTPAEPLLPSKNWLHEQLLAAITASNGRPSLGDLRGLTRSAPEAFATLVADLDALTKNGSVSPDSALFSLGALVRGFQESTVDSKYKSTQIRSAGVSTVTDRLTRKIAFAMPDPSTCREALPELLVLRDVVRYPGLSPSIDPYIASGARASSPDDLRSLATRPGLTLSDTSLSLLDHYCKYLEGNLHQLSPNWARVAADFERPAIDSISSILKSSDSGPAVLAATHSLLGTHTGLSFEISMAGVDVPSAAVPRESHYQVSLVRDATGGLYLEERECHLRGNFPASRCSGLTQLYLRPDGSSESYRYGEASRNTGILVRLAEHIQSGGWASHVLTTPITIPAPTKRERPYEVELLKIFREPGVSMLTSSSSEYDVTVARNGVNEILVQVRSEHSPFTQVRFCSEGAVLGSIVGDDPRVKSSQVFESLMDDVRLERTVWRSGAGVPFGPRLTRGARALRALEEIRATSLSEATPPGTNVGNVLRRERSQDTSQAASDEDSSSSDIVAVETQKVSVKFPSGMQLSAKRITDVYDDGSTHTSWNIACGGNKYDLQGVAPEVTIARGWRVAPNSQPEIEERVLNEVLDDLDRLIAPYLDSDPYFRVERAVRSLEYTGEAQGLRIVRTAESLSIEIPTTIGNHTITQKKEAGGHLLYSVEVPSLGTPIEIRLGQKMPHGLEEFLGTIERSFAVPTNWKES